MLRKILNNRYKIIKELGKGGMAVVFEAQDLLLDRKVALKMLRQEYVNDKDFVKKFRHEAKAVAKLSHPNVVNIFDIGQEGDYQYLVMEEIEGENLKSIIKKRGILSIPEALDIANQICAALITAHQNNIIHCDIKPHNILITSDKQVKVTDFGIARAITSSTITMTDTVVGSAHYFSPEQARGGEIKAHSDLYSLGIVLYEMLTGEVPFKGDSPISVALKHIQEEPKKPSLLNPAITPELEKLVMKAIAKEPEARFSNAAEMRETITKVLKDFQRSKGRNIKYEVADTGDTKILKKVDLTDTQNKSKKKKDYLTDPGKRRGLPKALKWVLGLIILFSILTVSFFFFYQRYMEVPVVEVPDLIGLNLKEGQKIADQVGLHIEEQNDGVYHPEVPEGNIISQYPNSGEFVRQTRPILVTISKGPQVLTVPDLRYLSFREAQVILDNKNLLLGDREYVFNDEFSEGKIIGSEPGPGEVINVSEKINLLISKGPQPRMITVPNVIGLVREEALTKIKESGFQVGEIREEMTRRFKYNQVARQKYQAGSELPAETKIDLTISIGLINTEDAIVHSVIIRFSILPGPSEQNVKIIVTDNNGRDVVYERLHKPYDKISQVINSVGPTVFEVYIDDILLQKKEVGF